MLSEVYATRGFVNSRQKHSYIDQSECSIIIIDFSLKLEHAVAEVFQVRDQLNPCQIAHMHAEISGGLLFMLTRACCLNRTPNGTKLSCKHLGSCSCVSCWQILMGTLQLVTYLQPHGLRIQPSSCRTMRALLEISLKNNNISMLYYNARSLYPKSLIN